MSFLSFIPPHWDKPVYEFHKTGGKDILIDVTTSVSSGLDPNHVLIEKVIPYFRQHNVDKILDFGAGSLRHALPLVRAGFTVGAIDFKEGYSRPICHKHLKELCGNDRFCLMEWPHTFCGNSKIFRGRFDAALLIYVLQTMPVPKERKEAMNFISSKLKWHEAYLFYCSRYNQLNGGNHKRYAVSDGYYMYPKRKYHSFYREFTTSETHAFMAKYKFERVKSFSERGTDQMFMYLRWDYP